LLWAIYLLVLEKPGHRSKIYIGSGTSASGGFAARFGQYDNLLLLPLRVEDALNDGYIIVHKGLLYWSPIPRAALVPVYRLLFIALEAGFAYLLWAMCARKGDYGMGHICPWDRNTLEYDGLCSHPCLNEGIRGDFDMTAEQLEAQAIEREQKRLALKKENATNHHYRQMETNYDEYIGEAGERVAKSRANNPGRDAKHQADRITKALDEKTFHCRRCDLSFGTKQRLSDHEQTPKHKRKLTESSNPFKCVLCNLGFHNKSNLTRHNTSERHLKKLAVVESSVKLD
jgi:rubrerythrin